MGNNYLIHMLKFEILPFRYLNLLNDCGSFLVCFPNYLYLAYPKIHVKYFAMNMDQEVESEELPLKPSNVEDYLK
jgi:hypothetical protein